ncbi:MAG: hypothetical protein HYY31_03175 [Chloroflexi bacterium]|nr:hypothetical protein [Chloroflexota bacterium]
MTIKYVGDRRQRGSKKLPAPETLPIPAEIKERERQGLRWPSRRPRKLPVAVLIAIALFLVTATAVLAYVILTITGTVTVPEAIEVSPSTFQVQAYPAETWVQQVTLTNRGSAEIEVELGNPEVTGPEPSKLNVTVPSRVTVPGNSSQVVSIRVAAHQSITPGTYEIRVSVSR